MSSAERQQAYAADITYGTNNEMGFDYLRDNMAIYKSQMVQRGHAFAIVDEVDSILLVFTGYFAASNSARISSVGAGNTYAGIAAGEVRGGIVLIYGHGYAAAVKRISLKN